MSSAISTTLAVKYRHYFQTAPQTWNR